MKEVEQIHGGNKQLSPEEMEKLKQEGDKAMSWLENVFSKENLEKIKNTVDEHKDKLKSISDKAE